MAPKYEAASLERCKRGLQVKRCLQVEFHTELCSENGNYTETNDFPSTKTSIQGSK